MGTADRWADGWQTMLATAGCTPQKFRLVVVQLQTVRVHPVCNGAETHVDVQQECVDVSWRAGTKDLCVVSVEVWRQAESGYECNQVGGVQDE